uniref:Elongation of very long chain fatty acids protein n=1 Tax=Ciona intestinalis TaxID=7719 RepID=Q5SE06_CIOIN|nr:polyunsaturated fatty acid elongase [Ciona intestinalis]AAV67802.1 polyunsaturated fatty acid elongase [Ciona intestinalis]|eukprot:NP_001029014.1 polyunsaturated fatty acid elongase [Ciona intestinalis]
MDVLHRFLGFYEWTLTFADPRVAKWPLIENPLPTIAIVLLYLAFVLYIGPRFMRKRAPVDFGLFLPGYNFALVALNYYILQEVVTGSYGAGYDLVCTPLRSDSYDPNEMKVANAVWWYYVSKIIELFDTVLFTLRKRDRQVTFLHVYHHSTMPLLWWIGAKWVPGGQSFVGIILNSSVHVIMYTYYGLSALGPHMQKFLWWKKYITMLQLVQFVLAIYHTARSLYVKCPSPVWMHWALILYAFSFILLFSNFYMHAYIKKSRKGKENGSRGKGGVSNGKEKLHANGKTD